MVEEILDGVNGVRAGGHQLITAPPSTFHACPVT
jgi:hypothetical protein